MQNLRGVENALAGVQWQSLAEEESSIQHTATRRRRTLNCSTYHRNTTSNAEKVRPQRIRWQSRLRNH